MPVKVKVEVRREELVVEIRVTQEDKELELLVLKINLRVLEKILLDLLQTKLPPWIVVKPEEL